MIHNKKDDDNRPKFKPLFGLYRSKMYRYVDPSQVNYVNHRYVSNPDLHKDSSSISSSNDGNLPQQNYSYFDNHHQNNGTNSGIVNNNGVITRNNNNDVKMNNRFADSHSLEMQSLLEQQQLQQQIKQMQNSRRSYSLFHLCQNNDEMNGSSSKKRRFRCSFLCLVLLACFIITFSIGVVTNIFTTSYLYEVKTYLSSSFNDRKIDGDNNNEYSNDNNNRNNKPMSSSRSVGSMYRGVPWISERTVNVVTLGETPFARCDMHTVRPLNKNKDGKSNNNDGLIDDWIFLEEMDAINAIVLTGGEKKNFLFFQQTKYAIPGITFSPVGGMIEHNESPFEAAKREVKEELGMGSRRTLQQMQADIQRRLQQSQGEELTLDKEEKKFSDAFDNIPKSPKVLDSFGLAQGDVSNDEPDWIFLGRYRTAANRGGGFVYTYLLKEAVPILPNGGTSQFASTGDDESQILFAISQEEAITTLLTNGLLQEVKWAATMSLALLHLELGMPSVTTKTTTTSVVTATATTTTNQPQSRLLSV